MWLDHFEEILVDNSNIIFMYIGIVALINQLRLMFVRVTF